jgi:hypothetical protein
MNYSDFFKAHYDAPITVEVISGYSRRSFKVDSLDDVYRYVERNNLAATPVVVSDTLVKLYDTQGQ